MRDARLTEASAETSFLMTSGATFELLDVDAGARPDGTANTASELFDRLNDCFEDRAIAEPGQH